MPLSNPFRLRLYLALAACAAAGPAAAQNTVAPLADVPPIAGAQETDPVNKIAASLKDIVEQAKAADDLTSFLWTALPDGSSFVVKNDLNNDEFRAATKRMIAHWAAKKTGDAAVVVYLCRTRRQAPLARSLGRWTRTGGSDRVTLIDEDASDGLTEEVPVGPFSDLRGPEWPMAFFQDAAESARHILYPPKLEPLKLSEVGRNGGHLGDVAPLPRPWETGPAPNLEPVMPGR